MNLQELMKVVLFTRGITGRWGLPVIFTGTPGSGKTTRITNTCTEFGFSTDVVLASLRDPSEFIGLGVPEGDGVMRRYVDKWIHNASKSARSVVFFDEIGTCVPATQKALLRVILEGVAGDVSLPDTIRFVAAQNSIEDAPDGYELSAALNNRFGHIDWPEVDIDQWMIAMAGGFKNSSVPPDKKYAVKLEAEVDDKWNAAFTRAATLVGGFVCARPDTLNKRVVGSAAYASPRTWDYVARVLAGCEIHNASVETRDLLVSAFIGEDIAVEFIAYIGTLDLPDPALLLDGKVKFMFNNRMDRTCAVLMSCAVCIERTNDANLQVIRSTEYVRLLDALTLTAQDIALVGLTYFQSMSCGSKMLINKNTGGSNLMAKLSDVNREAGVLTQH